MFCPAWEQAGEQSMKKNRCVLFCGLVVLTAALLAGMLLVPSGKTKTQTGARLDVAGKYMMRVNNQISDALEGIASVKKTYWISEDAVAAPKPDPKRYGKTDDPKSLQWLLDEAEEVLEGQKLLFTTDVELLEGSEVTYYLDETILAITWKQAVQNMAVTYSEVKIMDPSQFRRFLAGGEFGSGKLLLTTEMAETVNAVVACSGDFYSYRPDGTMISGGVARRANYAIPDLCFVDKKGDLILTRYDYLPTLEAAQKFADENEIVFSLAFGPILVKDGKRCEMLNYPVGEVDENYTRAAICQMDSLHYLFVACNREGACYYAPSINVFAQCVAETGCKQAYNLDGGQTATVVMNNELINHVNYGSQRKISDIIYFATAKPIGE